MSGERFPNDQLLVTTDWVADHLDDPDVRIVEVTPPGSGYVFGHLPRAVYLDLGDVFSLLGKEPAHAIQDLIPMGEDADREAILGVGTEFHSHLWAFGSPHDPTMSAIGGEVMGKVLRTLGSTFDFVVVDATAEYSDAVLAAFDLSDEVLMIATLDVVGVRHLSLDLQTMLSLGFPPERFRLVLNRADSKVGLSPADVDRVLNVKVDTFIPSSRLVPTSLNKGRPVVLEEPRSEVSRSVPPDITTCMKSSGESSGPPRPLGTHNRSRSASTTASKIGLGRRRSRSSASRCCSTRGARLRIFSKRPSTHFGSRAIIGCDSIASLYQFYVPTVRERLSGMQGRRIQLQMK